MSMAAKTKPDRLISDILIALAKQDFEIRLVEGGGLVVFDLLYEKEGQIRPMPPQFVGLVFNNADRIGEWLEREAHASDP
jgi:hypothetical protein